MAEEEKLAKKRQMLTRVEPVIIQPETVDQSGGMFLKGSENNLLFSNIPASAQPAFQPTQGGAMSPEAVDTSPVIANTSSKN